MGVSILLMKFLAPLIAITLFRRSSVWGGITYHVNKGRVVRVERPPQSPKPPVGAALVGGSQHGERQLGHRKFDGWRRWTGLDLNKFPPEVSETLLDVCPAGLVTSK